MGSNKDIIPTVGMGATRGCGSDSYPYTITKIIRNKKNAITGVEAQQDKATPAEGHDYYNDQRYTYTANTEAEVETYTLRKNGRWVEDGRGLWEPGVSLVLGTRRFYQDPSF